MSHVQFRILTCKDMQSPHLHWVLSPQLVVSRAVKNVQKHHPRTNLHHCPSSTSTQAIFISHSLLRFHVPNLLWFVCRRDPGHFQVRLEAFEAPGVADMVGSSMNRNTNIMAITWCIWVCVYIYVCVCVCLNVCLNVWIWAYIQTSIMGT